MKISDIAYIDSDREDINIGEIKIPADLFKDNLVDKMEIIKLVKENLSEIFFIYGNAVRINNKENAVFNSNENADILIAGTDAHDNNNEYIVKRGDNVRFVIRKNQLSIEVKAIAIDNGRLDDEIIVKLDNSSAGKTKTWKGRVKSKDLVEVLI